MTPRSEQEAARVRAVTLPTSDFSTIEPFEARPGGAASVPTQKGDAAFSQPSGNMEFERQLDFFLGNSLFKKLWVSSPASTKASDGLGPLYNARSCQRCHIKDGRGHPPEGPKDVSMILRVSVPGGDAGPMAGVPGYHITQPHPVYGGQLQTLGLPGQAAETRLDVSYTDRVVTLSEGERVTLRVPTYAAADLGYGPLGAAMLSPRVAPQMIGLGLLEAIPASDILALADEHDVDGDGISGKPNVVWSREFEQPMLGRFGLKAGMPTLREQSAAAALNDIGLSTPLLPDPWGDCTAAQPLCQDAPHGDGDERGHEMDARALNIMTFYARNLAVPERRNVSAPQVLRGKQVFYETGCTSCHTPKFVTHRMAGQPEQSFQLIWPYTDLLLHDMGDGLVDNRPEARATGREWRTPPLWGIGLTKQVTGRESYLHDGRARTLLEAVLWHGGEAEPHRDTVISMPRDDRNALIAFLGSL